MSEDKEKTPAAHPRRSPWAIRPIITEAELAEAKEIYADLRRGLRGIARRALVRVIKWSAPPDAR